MALETSKVNLPTKTWKRPKLNLRQVKHFKFIVVVGLAAIVVGLVMISNAMPLSAGVITLHPQDFTKGFTEEGEIIASQEWPIFNPVEGKLQSLKVKNGDTVKKGQVLFEMSTSDLNYQLDVLKAQFQSLEGQRLQAEKNPNDAQVAQQMLIIQQAEKDAQTEEQNLSRMKVLYEAGSISAVEYEAAQTAYEKAANVLEQQKTGLRLLHEQYIASLGTEQYYNNQKDAVQAQINQLDEKISNSTVSAFQDGIVKDLSLKEGEVIPQGQQVLTVFGVGGYKLESYVLASDTLDLKTGMLVQVIQETSSGNKTLKGHIEAIDPSAVERVSPLGLKENRVKVTILLTEPSPNVVLGSNVNVKFTTQDIPQKLIIPKTALFPYLQGDAVWVVEQGKAKIQPVKTGLENDSQVIIEQGLADGDTVLQDPNLANLKEGKRIKALS